tara:strand:- start:864 stop:1043 length:180 start_codon:yes stop_codon:yes gene_type:complete
MTKRDVATALVTRTNEAMLELGSIRDEAMRLAGRLKKAEAEREFAVLEMRLLSLIKKVR